MLNLRGVLRLALHGTNFSLVSRTKQLPLIKEFGIDGSYTLQKEADCIHKMWLNINISDIKLQYQEPTYKNIIEILRKYDL